jgi:hypothetical protein
MSPIRITIKVVAFLLFLKKTINGLSGLNGCGGEKTPHFNPLSFGCFFHWEELRPTPFDYAQGKEGSGATNKRCPNSGS